VIHLVFWFGSHFLCSLVSCSGPQATLNVLVP
jgi:hypothetical protein